MMCQFLGSTNKAEVLENMEFSRIAWEYQFDGGEMPHANIVTYSSDIPHARVDNSIKNILQFTAEVGKELHSRPLVLPSQFVP